MRMFNFIADSMRGTDGQPSSKKIAALIFIGMAFLDVATLLIILYLAIFKQVDFTRNTLEIYTFVGGSMLITLIGAALVLYGITAGQVVSITKALNPPPPATTKVEQSVNKVETQNINPGELKKSKTHDLKGQTVELMDIDRILEERKQTAFKERIIREYEKSKWIPVSERLPEIEKFYIARRVVPYLKFSDIVTYSPGIKSWIDYHGDSLPSGEVTHWREIPEME